jgi:hypothetical protein
LAAGAVVAAAIVIVALVVSRPYWRPRRIHFRDVTAQTGIVFRHTNGDSDRRDIVETIPGGLALLDYDGDGNVDIYFVNGAPLSETGGDAAPTNALYRNEGGFKFANVTGEAAVGDAGFGVGVAVGDYDNDGDPDIYVTNYGPNILYRNNGDGTFQDVTEAAGVDGGDKLGSGACFFDMDGDGDLDLYVANYVDLSDEKDVRATVHGLPVYAGPRRFEPAPDLLYRNNGDGTFTDVSGDSGIAARAGASLGVVCADHDNDGDTDVFVVNDGLGNFLFENDRTGKFEETGVVKGFAYDADGRTLGSRGVECGDYDNNGWLDLFSTSGGAELPVLYKNLGDGSFQDVTLVSRAGVRSLPAVTWGTGLVDFDNDGRRDLFISCGHYQENAQLVGSFSTYHVRNILLRNVGDGKFDDVSDRCGDGLAVKLSSRGAGFDDLDNDGDVDVVILNAGREPTILRNDSPGGNHWIQIRLQGVHTNREGVGARVKVVAGDSTQIDEVHGGRGYLSHYGSRLHFGLGKRGRVDRIEVHWAGGGVDVLESVGVDRLLTIKEGSAPAENPSSPDKKPN